MARNKSNQLTDGEQSIMEVLWKNGEASVRDITDELSKEKQTAYTTTQTLLNKFFGGSPKVLAQHLMQETDIDLDDLEALQRKVDQSKD